MGSVIYPLTDREQRQWLHEADTFCRQVEEAARVEAQKKLDDVGPDSLTPRERTLLGLDWMPRPHVKPIAMPRPHVKPPAPSPREVAAAALCPKHTKFRTPFLKQLNDHAIELTVRYGLTVKRNADGGKASARKEARWIQVPPVTNEGAYATFLHELGHVVEVDADSFQYEYVVKYDDRKSRSIVAPPAEVAAWRWAVGIAIAWTTPMQQCMHRALLSYASHANSVERRDMVACLCDAHLQVRGETWSVDELSAKCQELRRG